MDKLKHTSNVCKGCGKHFYQGRSINQHLDQSIKCLNTYIQATVTTQKGVLNKYNNTVHTHAALPATARQQSQFTYNVFEPQVEHIQPRQLDLDLSVASKLGTSLFLSW